MNIDQHTQSRHNRELFHDMLSWIEKGKSVRSFCQQPGMPSRKSLDKWRKSDPELAAKYLESREIGFAELADEVIDIADDGANDTYVDSYGHTKTNQDVIARSRLRVDTRLKLLACWDPSRYGTKMQVGGAHDLPPVTMSIEERAAKITALLAAAEYRRLQSN